MPQDNRYAGHPTGRTTIAEEHLVLTPHDTNPLPFYPKTVVCGATAGTVVVVDRFANEATYWLEAGQYLPVRPHIIKSTGTSATPLIGLKE
jgi:hypothetical protein